MSSAQKISMKKKRKRTMITREHAEKLEDAFQTEPWPNRSQKEELANSMGKDVEFVSIWFQNKRARIKREEQKELKRTIIKNKAKMQALSSQKIPISRSYGDTKLRAQSVACGARGISSTAPAVAALLKKPQLSARARAHSTGRTPPKTSRGIQSQHSANDGENQEAGDVSKGGKNKEDNMLTASSSFTKKPQDADIPPRSAQVGLDNGRDLQKACKVKGQEKFEVEFEFLGERKATQTCENADNFEDSAKTPRTREVHAVSSVVQMPKSTCSTPQTNATIHPKMKYTHNVNGWGQSLPRCSIVSAAGVESGSRNPFTLYRAIIRMVALVEGDIIDKSDSEFDAAINDALYGIIINDDCRLVYDKDSGLEFVDME